MSGQEENAPRTDPWRYAALGASSIFDLSGQMTRDALDESSKKAAKPAAPTGSAVAMSTMALAAAWQAVGEALAGAMRTFRQEHGL